MRERKQHEPMRIAGKKVDAEKNIEVEYPYTGEIIGTVPAGNSQHAKQALDIAANYNPQLTRYERQKILQNTAEELVKSGQLEIFTPSYFFLVRKPLN